ncbi:acetate kinase [Pseudarthrobacter chlorophenolicus A6]|uniref:Acetate kinase n=1 Tax=Pseudarthrobacter chlorophenolicus (strain ATCC 700700 / DSM 12829 / CIP 107037 / JCM 12360 / KCTC 9906 / NCIMB 13794 / A6) TaxID=452863 RepID=ACKA_PSECP|nr:acetate kinase [Pseudarthrobacter chlorophenolicus]B8HF37.1 RecName: Full=Acetate kinase; AltName: Full=Acetokinase [Pseudarthrobacter chlorophenolicus A6]ACL41005.1 acetate kinase [Pseudarthrobacter chlorophenolicus A6]SDQ71477.1 acetate kinase [Pseudarthrobacter chlorophenolicus]
MLVLVINSGSSSLKFQVRDVAAGTVLTEGLIEKIGMGNGGDGDGEIVGPRDHAEALEQVEAAIHEELGDLKLGAVGHRVVHGGERFGEPVLIDNEITRAIERLNPLAPLHNPANVLGIRAITRKWPDMPQVAVFDTAFHRTLPEHAWRYAVPDELYTNHGIRRYGFHGTSHEYVARRAAALLDLPVEEFDAVIAHLGNGASITAIQGGHSVDTSMGFTPLEGLVMGTRSGDLDPSILVFLGRAGWTPEDLDSMLNRESGLKGLAGNNDMRSVVEASEDGDAKAAMALAVTSYRLAKYIGGYHVAVGGAKALVFTAGIGENSHQFRALVADRLGALGVEVDAGLNAARSKEPRIISTPQSAIPVLVVPTDEERAIAEATAAVAGSGR